MKRPSCRVAFFNWINTIWLTSQLNLDHLFLTKKSNINGPIKPIKQFTIDIPMYNFLLLL